MLSNNIVFREQWMSMIITGVTRNTYTVMLNIQVLDSSKSKKRKFRGLNLFW